MSGHEPVLMEASGPVATLTLNRPDRRNAADGAMVSALHQRLDELEQSAADVVVLRGAGGTFCAGGDLDHLAALSAGGADAAAGPCRELVSVPSRLEALPQVVVGAVEGAAVGFGLCLVLRTDVAVAAASARFGAPELAAGIRPTGVMAELLRGVQPRVALDWLLRPYLRSAAEAAAAAVVHAVVPDDELDGAVDRLVEEMAAAPAGLLRSTKALWRELGALPPADRVARAADAAAESLCWPSTREALAVRRRRPR